jgi:uncharacterized protein
MKRAFKILGWTLLLLVILVIGFGLYMYNSNPMIKAVVDNDESKLFYFPVKEVEGLSEFNYEEIPLEVEDTVTVYAYLFKPATDSVKASIFFIHGSGGNVGRYAKMIKPLVESGFQVYTLDWRGFGKSNGKPLHTNVLEDTKSAFRDMMNRKEVNSTKVVVFGQSLGGQVAVRLTKDFESRIDGLVLDGSIASFPTLAADFAPIEFLRKRAESNPDDFNQPYIAIEDIKEIKETPKLIIQSSDDRTVTPIRGEMLFENAKEPKEFWQTEGEHIYTLVDYPAETVERIENLID